MFLASAGSTARDKKAARRHLQLLDTPVLADRPQLEVEQVAGAPDLAAETAADDVFVDVAGGVFSAEKDR